MESFIAVTGEAAKVKFIEKGPDAVIYISSTGLLF
jgi:hypothetical protein